LPLSSSAFPQVVSGICFQSQSSELPSIPDTS
jgi:hypothetical protein